MIEVGEYVRFDDGQIKLVTQELKDFIEEHESLSEKDLIENLGIVKHSKQLIDLIENKQLIDLIENKDILKLKTSDSKEVFFIGVDEDTSDVKYEEIITDIKNGENELLGILTHEQFEANCYKVGGE